MPEDVRWMQRFQNYKAALATLQSAEALASQRPLNELEQLGLIRGFEFTFKLSSKVLKQYFIEEAKTEIIGPCGEIQKARDSGLILDDTPWLDMSLVDNLDACAYDQALALNLTQEIRSRFLPAFVALAERIDAMATTGDATFGQHS